MKPCLVVYYSRTGMTQQIASKIASACHCDIEPIREPQSRQGLAGYLRSVYEALTGKMPDILPPAADPGAYDVVVLGTPVWAGRVSSPMRTYIHRYGGQFNRIAGFCTMGGSGGDRVMDEVSALCGKPTISRLIISDNEIKHESYADKVGAFAKGAVPALQ